MLNAANLRRLALELPETYEDTHRLRPAFRVNRRIFAMLGVTGNEAMFLELADEGVAVLKLDRGDQLNMAAMWNGAVSPTTAYGHHGWTRVRLSEVDEPTLTTLVRLAWTHVAPKRLSAAAKRRTAPSTPSVKSC